MNASPFLRRLRHVAPRRNGNPDKPVNARQRLAMMRGKRARQVSFYDYRMGGYIHALRNQIRNLIPDARRRPECIANAESIARQQSARLNRMAWRARRGGLRLTRSALVWARRANGWRAGPALVAYAYRKAFPRYGAFYIRTMREDAAPLR